MKRVQWGKLLLLGLVVMSLMIVVAAVSVPNARQFFNAVLHFPAAQEQLQQRATMASTVDQQLTEFRDNRTTIDQAVITPRSLPDLQQNLADLLARNDQLIVELGQLQAADEAIIPLTAGRTTQVVTLLTDIDRRTLTEQQQWGEVYQRKKDLFNVYQQYSSAIACQNKVNFKAKDASILKQLQACEKQVNQAVETYHQLVEDHQVNQADFEQYTKLWLQHTQTLRRSYQKLVAGDNKKAISLASDAKKLGKQVAAYDLAKLISQYEAALTAQPLAEIASLEGELISLRQQLSGLNQEQWFSL